jgi:hypothetical protein
MCSGLEEGTPSTSGSCAPSASSASARRAARSTTSCCCSQSRCADTSAACANPNQLRPLAQCLCSVALLRACGLMRTYYRPSLKVSPSGRPVLRGYVTTPDRSLQRAAAGACTRTCVLLLRALPHPHATRSFPERPHLRGPGRHACSCELVPKLLAAPCALPAHRRCGRLRGFVAANHRRVCCALRLQRGRLCTLSRCTSWPAAHADASQNILNVPPLARRPPAGHAQQRQDGASCGAWTD